MTINRTPEQVVNVNDVSRISAGTTVKGEMFSDSDIRVDGTVDGKLYSKGRIVVGENALIKGSVLCNDVDLWGKFEGEMFVKNVLSLKSTSVVDGAINVRKLQVEMGAQINGSCHMISESEYDKAVVAAGVKVAEPAKVAAPKAAPQQ